MGDPQGGPIDVATLAGQITKAIKTVLTPLGAGDSVGAGLDALTAQLQALTAGVSYVAARNPDDIAEIERQIFFQFLDRQIQYLTGHQTASPKALTQRIQHDMLAGKQKQKQLRLLLQRAFAVDGVDALAKPLLNQQRAETLKSFIAMMMQEPDNYFSPTLELFLDKKENGLMRRVLKSQLTLAGQVVDFDAGAAWGVLVMVWNSFSSSQPSRFNALKQAWAAAGGGNDVSDKTPPAALKMINDYYAALYQRAESGGFNTGSGFMLGSFPI